MGVGVKHRGIPKMPTSLPSWQGIEVVRRDWCLLAARRFSLAVGGCLAHGRGDAFFFWGGVAAVSP